MSALPDPSKYRISGFTSGDGAPIYHPNVWHQMLADGVIDRHGHVLPPRPEPILDYSKPPVVCERIGWSM